MGGLGSEALNAITRQIWHWCIDRGNWPVCEHVPGIENCYADHLSRFFNDNIEWSLVPKIFDQLCAEFFTPEIDLLASRLNAQGEKYFSWFPDHHSQGTDALSQSWQSFKVYAFPPFCLIPRVLHKIDTEYEDTILIFPFWPTKPWFPILSQMLVTTPIILPPLDFSLYLPYRPDKIHLLYPKIRLAGAALSRNIYRREEFQRKLHTLSAEAGKQTRLFNTNQFFKNGWFSVCGTKIISYRRLETGNLS